MRKQVALVLILLFFKTVSFCFANTPPEIIDHGVFPEIASPGQTITFWLWYQDKDGDPPEYVRIYLHDGWHEMKKKEGSNFADKVKYEYQRTATSEEGGLEFYFEASDGQSKARMPDYQDGTFLAEVLKEKVENNKIYLFSRKEGKPLWQFDTGPDWVQKIAISKDGDYLAVKTNDFIYFFSKDNPQPLWRYQCMTDLGQNKEAFAGWVDISADGQYIAAGCQLGLYLFHRENNQPLWSYSTQVFSVAISDDGRVIALGTFGGESDRKKGDSVFVFSPESNQPLWQYRAEGNVHALAVSADGNYVAAGSHCPERKAYLFSSKSNRPLIDYVASQDSPVWAAVVSENNKYAVYGLDGGDGFPNIFVFSVGQKKLVQQYKVNQWVRSLAISADGDYFVAASGNQNIYLFSPNSSQPLWQFKTGGKVGSVDISADGNYFVAGSQDKNIYFFERGKEKPLWQYQASTWVNTVAISADGQYLAAGTGAQQYLGEMHAGLKDKEEKEEAVCGDTICEREKGESHSSCPKDCVGEGSEKQPNKRYWPLLLGSGVVIFLFGFFSWRKFFRSK